MKNEKKELARVEKRLREVIEAMLERGDALVPNTYGVDIQLDGSVKPERNGCYACLLGSVVLDELSRRRLPRVRTLNVYEIAGDILSIDASRRDALEAGFMQWAEQENSTLPWYARGERLRADYYETAWA